jgi:hypothetical protein
MRTLYLALVIAAGLGAASCNRNRNEPAAHQAGREAYKATQQIKKGAKEAAKELHSAGKQFREGWKEQKQAPPRDTKRQDADREKR